MTSRSPLSGPTTSPESGELATLAFPSVTEKVNITAQLSAQDTIIHHLDAAFTSPWQTRTRLTELIAVGTLSEAGAAYTLSILAPIPTDELLTKDRGYRFAVDCALTYGVYVAPLTLAPISPTNMRLHLEGAPSTIEVLVDAIQRRASPYLAEDATPTTLLEKLLLNSDPHFAQAFFSLDQEIKNMHHEVGRGMEPTVKNALIRVSQHLQVTASDRYRYLLENS